MTKKDLKTGMRTQYRSGEIRLVMLDTEYGDILCGDGYYAELSYYSKNLKCIGTPIIDIVAVYESPNTAECNDITKLGDKIWERKENIMDLIEAIQKLKEGKKVVHYQVINNNITNNNPCFLEDVNGHLALTDEQGHFLDGMIPLDNWFEPPYNILTLSQALLRLADGGSVLCIFKDSISKEIKRIIFEPARQKFFMEYITRDMISNGEWYIID